MRRGINKKGQMIFSEYVMIFFVVIAAATAMTVFVQRTFKAKIHDARNIMIATANSMADANFLMATGSSSIPYEYEPYYDVHGSAVAQIENDTSGATSGNPAVMGVTYIKKVNHQTGTLANSSQLPPECAAPNPPTYCANEGQCFCSKNAVCGMDTCGNPYGCGACPAKLQACSGTYCSAVNTCSVISTCNLYYCSGTYCSAASNTCSSSSDCNFNYRCVSAQCVICPIVNGSYDCSAGL